MTDDRTTGPEDHGRDVDPSADAEAAGDRPVRRGAGDHAGATAEKDGRNHALHAAREFVIVVALALVLSLAVKTWLMQAFFIPSGSMEDTLVQGDRVVVSKLTPRPFALERGDIVVFEDPDSWLPPVPPTERTGASAAVHDALVFVGLLPNDSDSHLIKRVIGLPGDRVKCCSASGKITVNGAEITEPYLKAGNAPSNERFDITVPEDRVWVMGDHRSDSSDSRFHPVDGNLSQGAVPISKVVGRAVAVVWPLSDLTWLSQPSEVFGRVPAAR